ncbi:hypothetical protein JCM19000A_08040 [Silvimonas sp. JCM 19000]
MSTGRYVLWLMNAAREKLMRMPTHSTLLALLLALATGLAFALTPEPVATPPHLLLPVAEPPDARPLAAAASGVPARQRQRAHRASAAR